MAAEDHNKPSSLPPYPQMILRAMEALNEENGSNKTSISKYIESTYGQLPTGHKALLSHHLNTMTQNGELVFWKNNYTKYDPSAPPRRGRGRPPKPKPGDPVPSQTLSASPKPPKIKVAAGSGRPRGRPRKMARPTSGLGGATAAAAASSRRGRGRPPKTKASLTEVGVEQ